MFLGFFWQYPSICLDNGSEPIRWQSIIWTNAHEIYWRRYAVLGGDKITPGFNGLGKPIAKRDEEYWILWFGALILQVWR